MDEINEIVPHALPFLQDEKIFQMHDEETGEAIGDPYSYNDWIQKIKDMSGVSHELLGCADCNSEKEKELSEKKVQDYLDHSIGFYKRVKREINANK